VGVGPGTGHRDGAARRYVPQVVAYRIHWDSTSTPPYAEGACFVGKTGIIKAEYMATIFEERRQPRDRSRAASTRPTLPRGS
jgi:hypothetical protein